MQIAIADGLLNMLIETYVDHDDINFSMHESDWLHTVVVRVMLEDKIGRITESTPSISVIFRDNCIYFDSNFAYSLHATFEYNDPTLFDSILLKIDQALRLAKSVRYHWIN